MTHGSEIDRSFAEAETDPYRWVFEDDTARSMQLQTMPTLPAIEVHDHLPAIPTTATPDVQPTRNRNVLKNALSIGIGLGAAVVFSSIFQGSDTNDLEARAPLTPMPSASSTPLENHTPSPTENPEPTPSVIQTPTEAPSALPSPTATETIAPPPVAPPEVAPAEPNPVLFDKYTIGYWNVFNTALSSVGPERDKKRMQGIADAINNQDPLIMEVGEVNSFSAPIIRDGLGDRFKTTSLVVGGKHVDGMTIYNKDILELVDEKTFVQSKMGIGPGFDPNRIRYGTVRLFKIKGTDQYLRSVNMHADTNPDGRTKDARTILEVLKNEDSSGPNPDNVINLVMGDANSNKFQKDRDQIYKIFTNSGKLILASNKAKEKINDDCDTHSTLNTPLDCNKDRASHIDQIYVEEKDDEDEGDVKDIIVYKYIIGANKDARWLSDHMRVTANLTFFNK